MIFKEALVYRLSRLSVLVFLVLAGACAAAKPKPEVPAAPVPPHVALAWLPTDSTLLAHVNVPAFRSSPLWSVWETLQRDRLAGESLVDPTKLENVTFGGVEAEGNQASFVVAATGPFGAGHVDALARARNLPPEQHGLLTFYRTERGAFAQVYPDLVLVCSLDRIDALAARATEGESIKLHETALFQSLARRVRWDDADAALLAEDPRGDAKALAKRRAERYGFALPLEDLVRAGAALKLGPNTAFVVAAEASGVPQAEALRTSLNNTLSSLQDNLIVSLLGLRPLIRALKVSQDATYVAVDGELSEGKFNELLEKIAGLLGVALSSGDASPPAP